MSSPWLPRLHSLIQRLCNCASGATVDNGPRRRPTTGPHRRRGRALHEPPRPAGLDGRRGRRGRPVAGHRLQPLRGPRRLVDAVLARRPPSSWPPVAPRSTAAAPCAGQVGEAAVLHHASTGDAPTSRSAAPPDRLLLRRAAQRAARPPARDAGSRSGSRSLAAAEARGEVRRRARPPPGGGVDRPADVTFAVMPSVVIDLDDDRAPVPPRSSRPRI